ncbi:hypothetical protein ACHAXT_006108 [Thalassiosira profunda]
MGRSTEAGRIMHLNECFELAFARPAGGAVDEITGAGLDVGCNAEQSAVALDDQGSVISVLQCILSDWGTKSQTNFYIPLDRYAGYSYLFDEGSEHEGDDFTEGNSGGHKSSHAQHHRYTFVHAEKPNNLHPHNWTRLDLLHGHLSTNHSEHGPLHIHTSPIAVSPMEASAKFQPPPMTLPYIHPHLEMPVPPLQLPWYFGALCMSFTFGGLVMLCLPPKWALRGRGRTSSEMGQRRRHWFPYFAFAWALTIVQGPCSFFADYVNMTNVSLWHTVDRFVACVMMSLEIAKMVALRPYTRPLIYLVYLCCVGGAAFCFLKSQGAQQTLNADGFVFWHNGWHLYPIVQTVVYMIEIGVNQRWGEYHSFEDEDEGNGDSERYRRGQNGGTLLRTRIMADAKAASPGLRRSRRIAGHKPEE